MSEHELIKLCKGNNRQGQQALFDHYKKKVMSICLRYAGSRLEADDILQDSFVKIFKSLMDDKIEIQSLEAWVHTITVNTAINAYKRRKMDFKQIDSIAENDELSDLESPLESLQAEELMTLIQSMPEGYRLIFSLYVIEGFTHKEIAERLGIHHSTSRSQLTHAKNWLKERLTKEKSIV